MGFEVGPEPEFSVALFRSSVNDSGEFDRSLLAAVLNFRSHRREIDLALRVIEENALALRMSG